MRKSLGKQFLGLRITMMVVAFGVVVFTMFKLNRQAGTLTPAEPGKERLTWCHTRVATLTDSTSEKKFTVHQEKLDWRIVEPENRSLNQIEIEKWLGKYCSIWIDKLNVNIMPEPKGVSGEFVIQFIDKTEAKFLKLDEDLYYFKGTLFRSPDWLTALQELRKLAGQL